MAPFRKRNGRLFSREKASWVTPEKDVGMKNNLRLFRQRAKLFSQMLYADKRNLVRPTVVDLFLTARCNAVCDYCYAIMKPIKNSEELTASQWASVIDDLYAMGCRMINLMGGEPLLRDDFSEILDYIVAKGIECDVNTNCYLVEENLEALKKCSQIFTSVDGDETAHDLNRGEGSFRRILRGIEIARGAGIPVRINCTMTKHNLHSIDYLIDFADEHDAYLTFTPMVRATEKLKDRAAGLMPEEEDAKDMFRRVKKMKSSTNRITNSDKSLDFFINYPVPIGTIVQRDSPSNIRNYYDKPCPYGRLQFFVISNGDVYSCHNMWNDPETLAKNVILDGTEAAIQFAHDSLTCQYCWLANLVEWNEFTSPAWLAKGIGITIEQAFNKGRRTNIGKAQGTPG